MDVSDVIESTKKLKKKLVALSTEKVLLDMAIQSSKNYTMIVKNKLEYLLQEKLYPTYYFDRFYFNGSKMDKHVDRASCEISVSVKYSQNLDSLESIF